MNTEETVAGFRHLVVQIFRFGIVGVISTLADYCGFLLLQSLDVHYLVASTTSYTLSIILNYWLSIKFVFVAREDRSRGTEFTIYVLLTLLGMVLNQVFLFICVSWLLMTSNWGKIVATILVMVYNFASRKMFIEK